jgi:hypothetical protein
MNARADSRAMTKVLDELSRLMAAYPHSKEYQRDAWFERFGITLYIAKR